MFPRRCNFWRRLPRKHNGGRNGCHHPMDPTIVLFILTLPKICNDFKGLTTPVTFVVQCEGFPENSMAAKMVLTVPWIRSCFLFLRFTRFATISKGLTTSVTFAEMVLTMLWIQPIWMESAKICVGLQEKFEKQLILRKVWKGLCLVCIPLCWLCLGGNLINNGQLKVGYRTQYHRGMPANDRQVQGPHIFTKMKSTKLAKTH